MVTTTKRIGDCTVGCSEELFHLLVLIAGTTDPVNTFADDQNRAFSYVSKDKKKETYWNSKFYKGIEELVHSTRNAALFDLHGWSGDNRQGNREVAGAYLANRLCGANKEKAFYGPSYKKKKIHIHLVGHSHGGNVMNEMTKQMSKLGTKWPATWKVKSFTYLSTPFFEKLHQVKIGSFVHPQAEVFHVYNEYDFTQRMLADFSLFTLNDAVQVQQIKESVENNLTNLVATYKAVPWSLTTDVYLNKDEGRQLYTATRNLLGGSFRSNSGFTSVIQCLQSIETIAVGLNKPIQYKVNKAIQANNTLTTSFTLLSGSHLASLKSAVAALTTNINESVRLLDEGIAKNTYSRKGFASAFLAGGLPLANNLAAFLNIPAGASNVAGSGVLWQTLVGVMGDAVEVFDNTVTKPETQFNGSRTIRHLNVTSLDAYHNSTQTANALKLLAKLEILEKRATAKPEANLLLDLVLILLVHNPKVRDMAHNFKSWAWYIDKLEIAATGDLDAVAKAIRTTMTNVSSALLSRFVGEIEDDRDTKPNESTGKRGSLPYLLRVSHSTSREVLHEKVKDFLQRMMKS